MLKQKGAERVLSSSRRKLEGILSTYARCSGVFFV